MQERRQIYEQVTELIQKIRAGSPDRHAVPLAHTWGLPAAKAVDDDVPSWGRLRHCPQGEQTPPALASVPRSTHSAMGTATRLAHQGSDRVVHNPHPLLPLPKLIYLSLHYEGLGTHPKGQASVKFRSERDALVDMLATAGRAVGGRGGSSPVLLGLLLTCDGNVLVGHRDRPGPDHSGDRGGDRDRRRELCHSGAALHRHRAPARAGRGDICRRGRPHHHQRRPARPSNCTRTRSWSSRRWARPTSRRPNFRRPHWVRPCARSSGPLPTTTAGPC